MGFEIQERISMKVPYNLDMLDRSKVIEDGGRKRDVKSRKPQTVEVTMVIIVLLGADVEFNWF